MRFRSKTYKVVCRDGSVRTVYRDMNDAFPLALKGLQTSLTASTEGIAGATASISAEHKDIIHSALVAIDSKNSSLMMDYRMVYAVYQSNPCGEGDYLRTRTDEIRGAHQRLIDLDMKIQGLIALAKQSRNSEMFARMYAEIVGEVGGGAPALTRAVARDAIQQARSDAGSWVGTKADEPGGNAR